MHEELAKRTAGIADQGYIPEGAPKVPSSRTPRSKFPTVRAMWEDIDGDVMCHHI
jgi:hypothetical protein